MLPALLQLDRQSSAPALITAEGQMSWDELRASVERDVKLLANVSGRCVGLLLSPTKSAISRLIALAKLDCHIFLVADDSSIESLDRWATEFDWSYVISAADISAKEAAVNETAGSELEPGRVTILTSGTTGVPKAVEHTWASLARPVRRLTTEAKPRWLLTFRPHLYAGLQVTLQCLLNHGTLIMPAAGASADEVVKLAAQHRVEYASATPSYWRWLLTMADRQTLSSIPLRQITLGGEAVDQATLDALARLFPDARVAHIYATTELGRCFSVTDGRAGFPSAFLDRISPDGVEMRIVDGELVVRSANAMRRYGGSDDGVAEAGWLPTGDLVRREDDRIFFVGRKTDMINVGGNKVHPVEVENVIRQVPGVADVRVYGKSSSLVGQLVGCELVVAAGFDAAHVEQAVRERTLADLTPYQRPRWLTVVDELPLTTAGKTRRSD